MSKIKYDNYPQSVFPKEALLLFGHCSSEYIVRCEELASYFAKYSRRSGDTVFDYLKLLAFVYNTGRIQGKREPASI